MSARADEQIRADMVEVGRRLYARGYVASNDGNISVRLGDGRFIFDDQYPGLVSHFTADSMSARAVWRTSAPLTT